MTVIIGSARISEHGTTTGSAGDQTGNEVSTQEFYMHSKGWVILRAKSDDVAEKLATAMQQACDNDNIGYDQGERDSLLKQFEKTKSIKAITTKCECDCSSLVRVCIYQAAGTLIGDFTTASEPDVLVSSGLFEKKTCNSVSDVLNGDVLCTKTKGHTVIVISGARRTSNSNSSTGSTSSGGSTSSTTKSTGTTSTSKLSVDGQIGKNTVKKLQQVMGQTGNNVDGFIDGQQSASKQYWTSIISEACKWTGGASAVVKKFQQFLKDNGYDPSGVDGKLGKNTAKAAQKYLIAKGFSCGSSGADGYFGTNSAKALQNWLNTK